MLVNNYLINDFYNMQQDGVFDSFFRLVQKDLHRTKKIRIYIVFNAFVKDMSKVFEYPPRYEYVKRNDLHYMTLSLFYSNGGSKVFSYEASARTNSTTDEVKFALKSSILAMINLLSH